MYSPTWYTFKTRRPVCAVDLGVLDVSRAARRPFRGAFGQNATCLLPPPSPPWRKLHSTNLFYLKRSAIAFEAFATGIAPAIISHYQQPAPRDKIQPPCVFYLAHTCLPTYSLSDVRVPAYFHSAYWYPVGVNPFAMLESVHLAGIAYEHLLGSNEDLKACAGCHCYRENVDFHAKFRDLDSLSNIFTKLATPPDGNTVDAPARLLTRRAILARLLSSLLCFSRLLPPPRCLLSPGQPNPRSMLTIILPGAARRIAQQKRVRAARLTSRVSLMPK
ncbi:hypothetical protein PENSPDRAFT_671736 [Peniophora sp. CONT]|nr:hypothetical protein PENSPDRAFT_671736 [Peniophora sp. CONT]